MRRWWSGLERRERIVLGGGATLAALLLGWAILWDPLVRAHSEARLRLGEDLRRIEPLRAQAIALKARPARQRAADQRSFLAVIDAGLREAGLAASLRRVEPLGERRVRIVLEGVAFDAAIGLLERLEAEQGSWVRELSAQRGEGPGIVDLRVTLERP
jgi:general secretion pathway protein M